MTLSMNQFEIQPVAGDLSLPRTGMVISAEVSSSESGAILPGEAVKIDTSAPYGGVPKVLKLTANTQAPFAVAIRNLKNATFEANDPLEIAMRNSIIWMTAGAAINPGSWVENVYTTGKVITNTGTNPTLGTALDKATGDGSLIRVLIQAPETESPSA